MSASSELIYQLRNHTHVVTIGLLAAGAFLGLVVGVVGGLSVLGWGVAVFGFAVVAGWVLWSRATILHVGRLQISESSATKRAWLLRAKGIPESNQKQQAPPTVIRADT